MRVTRRRLTCLLLLLVTLALPACDEENGDWDLPTDPGVEPEPGPGPMKTPVLTLTMQGQDQVVAGTVTNLALRLVNVGTGPADSVVVAVTVPRFLDLTQAETDHGAFDLAAARWTLADLDPDVTATLFLAGVVGPHEAGRQAAVSAVVDHVEPAGGAGDGHQAQIQFAVISMPPIARDDSYAVDEGGGIAIAAPGVLANDEDPNGEVLALQLEPLLPPSHGVVSLHADGSLIYVHDGSEVAADSLLYVVADAEAARDTATVRFAVTPVNDLPVLDAPTAVVVLEGQDFDPMPLDEMVSDADHPVDQLQWDVVGGNELTAEVSPARVLTVTTPGSDWHGSETLALRVHDPEGVLVSADVQFTVTTVNDPPVIAPMPSQTIMMGGVFLPIPLDNYVSDVDHDITDLVWTVTDEAPLLVSISPERVLTVLPPNDTWAGSVDVNLHATDPAGGTAERRVRFEVALEE